MSVRSLDSRMAAAIARPVQPVTPARLTLITGGEPSPTPILEHQLTQRRLTGLKGVEP